MNTTRYSAGVFLAVVLGALLAAGCSSVVQQSYRPAPAAAAVLLPYSGTTQVYGSVNMEYDAGRLEKDGYIQIGESAFKTGGHVTLDEIQAAAKDVGADIVLISKKLPGSNRTLQPLLSDNEGKPSALAPYTQVSGALTAFSGGYGDSGMVGGGSFAFKGKVTGSGIPGISAEEAAAIDEQRFDFTLGFWRRAKSP
ncbi:MAG TPA: hypothetical protein VII09_05765 [Opitutaceae bacterium]